MLEPRKNVPNLIRGWAEAVHARADPPALVLAGGSGWDDEVDAAVAAVPAHLRVLRPGYLRFGDLPGLPRRRARRRLPQPRRGLRPAGARGDGRARRRC